jgi:uncharacterized protein (DUF697 family)
MALIEEKYYRPVGTAVVAAAGLGVPGLFVPPLDMAGVGATWTGMVIAIAKKSGHEINTAAAGKIVAAAVGALGGYKLGSKLLTWAATPLLLTFPVAGVPAVVAANATLNALFTLKLGVATCKQFSRPGFGAKDTAELAVGIAGQLVPMPTRKEMGLVKELIRAAG